MRELRDWFESVFETFLFNSRLIVILAVLGSLTSSVLMFVRGAILIFHSTKHFVHSWKDPHDEELSISLISSVDSFLFATVLLIFAMGIYELFISKIDPASRTDESRPNWLQIHSLDDLKGAVGKVILMILIVRLFESAVKMKYDHPLHLLYLGLSVLFVAAALYLQHLAHKHEKPHAAEHGQGEHATSSTPAPAHAAAKPAYAATSRAAHAAGHHGPQVVHGSLPPVSPPAPHGVYGRVAEDATMAMGMAPQQGNPGSPAPPYAMASPPMAASPSQVPQVPSPLGSALGPAHLSPSYAPPPVGSAPMQGSAPTGQHAAVHGPGPSQPPQGQQGWPPNGPPQGRGW